MNICVPCPNTPHLCLASYFDYKPLTTTTDLWVRLQQDYPNLSTSSPGEGLTPEVAILPVSSQLFTAKKAPQLPC